MALDALLAAARALGALGLILLRVVEPLHAGSLDVDGLLPPCQAIIVQLKILLAPRHACLRHHRMPALGVVKNRGDVLGLQNLLLLVKIAEWRLVVYPVFARHHTI